VLDGFILRLAHVRSAAAGATCRKGTVVSLVTPGEAFVVEKLARKLRIKIPEAEVTGGELAVLPARR